MNVNSSTALEQLAARVTKLEEVFTHLQAYAQDLDEVIRGLQKRTDRMEGELTGTKRQLVGLLETTDPNRTPEDDRPPHY